MTFESWCVLVGFLLLGMALIPCRLERWPITTAVIYLGIGLLLGPFAFHKIQFSPLKDSALLERLTEIAAIVSLFTAGLKLRLPLEDLRWLVPLRLAFISMALTVGMVTLVGVYLLHLPLGAAVLLGGILAPTDPVLASDVQVKHSGDDDRLRFSLTGEAGFNDGTAFPFVMLGLGLLGLYDLGGGWRWLGLDVVWSISGGLGVGALLGIAVARLVVWLRAQKREAVGSDDFLALGLIALAYGTALWLHTYGFLAVFAAGLALRQTERITSEKTEEIPDQTVQIPVDDEGMESLREDLATNPERAAGVMAREILRFNEALERIAEFGLVVMLGAMLSRATWNFQALWLAPLLFLFIRPVSIFCGLIGTKNMSDARPYLAWFGIRGIGSLYYLFYTMHHGLAPELSEKLASLTISVVAISIVVHGISVTPLMRFYENSHQD